MKSIVCWFFVLINAWSILFGYVISHFPNLEEYQEFCVKPKRVGNLIMISTHIGCWTHDFLHWEFRND